MAKLGTARVPGVGTVNLTNIGQLFSLFLGLFVLVGLYTYAQKAFGAARGYIPTVPGLARPEVGEEPTYDSVVAFR